jgi:hypothetical protein
MSPGSAPSTTGHGPELLPDRRQQLPAQIVARLVPLLQRHEGRYHLPPELIGPAGHSGLGYRPVLQERRLHLDRADAVVSDLDDLVGPAGEPHVAVLVEMSRIPHVVRAGIRSQ